MPGAIAVQIAPAECVGGACTEEFAIRRDVSVPQLAACRPSPQRRLRNPSPHLFGNGVVSSILQYLGACGPICWDGKSCLQRALQVLNRRPLHLGDCVDFRRNDCFEVDLLESIYDDSANSFVTSKLSKAQLCCALHCASSALIHDGRNSLMLKNEGYFAQN